MASGACIRGMAGLGEVGLLVEVGRSHEQPSRGCVLHLLHRGLWCGLNTHGFCSMVMWKVSLSVRRVRKIPLFGEEVPVGWYRRLSSPPQVIN